MIIVVSDPSGVDNEAQLINQLFDHGLQLLHLRKPGWEKDQLIQLLKNINKQHYNKIALHNHHEIADEHGICRLHFSEALRQQQQEFSTYKHYTLSTSVHKVEDLILPYAFSYCFYGPVFDSISKVGYARMQNNSLHSINTSVEVIAIGGVNDSNIDELKSLGYSGAALLGYIWQEPENAIQKFKKIKSKW